jgi:hypothetical protein
MKYKSSRFAARADAGNASARYGIHDGPLNTTATRLTARHLEAPTRFNALMVGTEVLTLDGALPVEFLNPGDRIITRNSGVARLMAVRAHLITVEAVSVSADNLGHDRPEQDMILPATQEVLVRDWRAAALFGASTALVPVSKLVDEEFVCDLGEMELRLVELIFDTPQIIYADGLEVAGGIPERARIN